jgi:hypothetical protein
LSLFFAHLRTVLEQSSHPAKLTPVIDTLSALGLAAITADPTVWSFQVPTPGAANP